MSNKGYYFLESPWLLDRSFAALSLGCCVVRGVELWILGAEFEKMWMTPTHQLTTTPQTLTSLLYPILKEQGRLERGNAQL